MIRILIRRNSGELRIRDLENTLRMSDPIVITRDGIHFNTLQGTRLINEAFQTRIEEIEGELRTTDALARTGLAGRGSRRSTVLDPLVNRFGPLTSKAGVAALAAPRWDVKKRLEDKLLGDNHWRAS